jgi:26S proteasome regulatory subunit N7
LTLTERTQVLASAEINALMPQMPVLTTLIKSLYDTNYADLFTALAQVEEKYLMPNPILAPHARYYVREMRVKAYTQILESYQSLTMERMSKAFGVSPSFIDA